MNVKNSFPWLDAFVQDLNDTNPQFFIYIILSGNMNKKLITEYIVGRKSPLKPQILNNI